MYQTYLAGVSCRKDGFKNCPNDGQPHIHFHSSTDLTLMEAGMFTLDFLVAENHEQLGFYRPQPIPEKDRFKRSTSPIQEHFQQHDEWMRERAREEELTAKKLLQDIAAYARGMAPLTEEARSVLGPFMNTERDLRNLLAVIHRDGGHHTKRVGITAAVEDAMKIVARLLASEGEWKGEKPPLSAEKLTALFVDTFKKLTLCEECSRGGSCFTFKCGVRKKNIEYAAEQFCNLTTESEPMTQTNQPQEEKTTGQPITWESGNIAGAIGVFVPKSNTPQLVIGDTIIQLDGLKLAQEDEISRLRGRIDELFAYNNEQVERRRAAENRVKELEAKLLSGEEKKLDADVRLAPVCATFRCARQPGPEARLFYHGYCCGTCLQSDANKHTAECEGRWQAHLDSDYPYPFPRLRDLDTILKRPTRPCLFKEKYGCTEITEYPYAWACDQCWQRYRSEDDSPAPQAVESAEDQVKRLGIFIMENVPGEPSRSEGAVDTAIRVLQSLLTTMGVYAEDIFSLVRRRNVPTEAAAEPTTCTVDVWDNMDSRSNPCGQPLPCSFHGPKKTKAAEIRDFASIIMENGLLGDLAQGLDKTEYKGRSMTDRLREKMEEAGVQMRIGPARISTRIQSWPRCDEWSNPNECAKCTLKKGDDYPDEPSIFYRFTFVTRGGQSWFVRGYYCNDCHQKLVMQAPCEDCGVVATLTLRFPAHMLCMDCTVKFDLQKQNPEVGVPSTVSGSVASAGGYSDDVPLLSSSDESRPSGAHVSEDLCRSAK